MSETLLCRGALSAAQEDPSPIGKARSLHSFFTSPVYVALVTTAGGRPATAGLETNGKEW